MNIGFYSARAGILSMQQGLDIVSNNIANSETAGFKELRPSFSDLLYTAQKPQYNEAQIGSGVKITKTDLMYEHGQLPTDGFFGFSNANGGVNFTKDGTFYIKQNGDAWQLVNSNGDNILDYDKNPVEITYKANGEINTEELMSKIGVFKFDNPFGLEAKGSNTYTQTASSGEGVSDRGLVKLNGALELSTVDLAEQMIKMIELQRGFQMNSKMVQTADELESIVNNLR